ncbi:MAG: serine--tRNA ligase [Dehalococcoidia bacterium]|nr:serine--tRNA ligase [Dehalococcoidia bacterium]
MIDIRFIRENTETVRQALIARNDVAPLDLILEIDVERRALISAQEELNRAKKEAARSSHGESSGGGRELRDQAKALDDKLREIDNKLADLLLQIPNIPQPSVPIGKSEDDNVVVRSWQEPQVFSFTPKPHWELGEKLGIIDFDRGVKLSGTRFYILKGLGARLERAIINLMLDMHTREGHYNEIYPPWMVKREVMTASGNLPKFAENLYHDDTDDIWFVPTAEVPLTSLHAGEILDGNLLPLRYAAYTACFRREKMSAGKDTRGIKRGHQFDKVELYKLTRPECSEQEHEMMLADVEQVCQRLGLAYRIKVLCTADISFSSSKTYDVEVWAPGCQEWLEVSSCSNCKDFQARRAGIRFRPEPDSKPEYVHTLNGSGLALPRIVIALLENYQQPDGSIIVPSALRIFMHTDIIS